MTEAERISGYENRPWITSTDTSLLQNYHIRLLCSKCKVCNFKFYMMLNLCCNWGKALLQACLEILKVNISHVMHFCFARMGTVNFIHLISLAMFCITCKTEMIMFCTLCSLYCLVVQSQVENSVWRVDSIVMMCHSCLESKHFLFVCMNQLHCQVIPGWDWCCISHTVYVNEVQ